MMQIIHRDTGNFRLAAILKIIINWDTGTLSLSYSAMAEKAGNCCSKTISREVKRYESLGLFVSTRGWKRPDGKAFKKRNTLRLAVPVQLPEGIFICDLVKQNLDTRGPDSATTQTDTGGPLERDSSGPITMYDHKKGRGRSSKAAAAVQRHQSPSIDATRQRRPAHQRAGEGAQCDLFGNGETS
ncbi:MAG: hypothetical protein KL863_09125 [Rhizobium sp.]|nr:hypothetical protein [Rhizobium sp.]